MPILEIFLAVAPEAIAAAEGTAAVTTAAEAAAATTAAAQAATAAEATQAATGIMQAAPAAETAALQANQVAALNIPSSQVVEVVAQPSNFIDQPFLGEVASPPAPPAPAAAPSPVASQGITSAPQQQLFNSPTIDAWEANGKYDGPPQLDAWEAKYNAMKSGFTPGQSFGPGQYGTGFTPGQSIGPGNPPEALETRLGPYSSFNPPPPASGVQNIEQFANPAPTTSAPSNVMPASVPGAQAPIQVTPEGYARYDEAIGSYGPVQGGTESPLMKGFNAVSNWAEKHPYQAAGLGYMAYSKLNQPEPYKPVAYSGPLSKFKISPNFQGQQANPQDFQYTPRKYASGGITDIHSYAKGKLTEDNVDVGIYRDADPDTANLDPLTAAMVRQSKLDKRNYVNTKAKFNKPTPMGTLNFDPVAGAAQGGIMGASNLGGYAAGGNPRLLRGPGDGMSDNIPATINNRQPARLADGEFVVPADVVSHLGNGSTEAGAKKLHEMMNKVRKARTGNQKQGKQINPNRFIPK